MKKHFNTTGPVFPAKHYCIDPMQRLDWEEIHHLIDAEKYFVLHAPRQTGKTSTLLKMMAVLNAGDQYKALYVNIEAAQAMRNDVEAGLAIVCETIASSARIYGIEPELEVLTDQLLKDRRSGGSAFNIKAESLRMGNLSLAEVWELYAQHTTETGQSFAEEIFAALWEDTKGQPWLVNALGHEMTWKDKTARDRSTPITFERYQAMPFN